ncbi:MAG: hypothetical protein AAF726_24120 [Planctomycetota bacterium]
MMLARLRTLGCSLPLLALVACSHSEGDANPSASTQGATITSSTQVPPLPPADPPARFFIVESVSVSDGSPWELNRPIDVAFSADVDFATVSSTTIRITESGGAPAVGAFSLLSPRVVRFQPRCPIDDGGETGLAAASSYKLEILDTSIAGAVTVLSTAGDVLREGDDVDFTTPDSADPMVLFADGAAGPPRVLVRGRDGEPADSRRASFVEFGDGTSEFLSFDPSTQAGSISGPVPPNLYSRPETRFAVVLRFDQPISADASNRDRTGLEYSYDQSTWTELPSTVAVLTNCGEVGASIRLAPAGIAPQGASIRAVVETGFEDITGDPVTADVTDAAVLEVDVVDPGDPDPADGSDELLESFSVGGDGPGSLEDTAFPTTKARARWSTSGNPGTLEPAVDPRLDGGPGGDFDWVVRAGDTFFLDTTFDTIVGGPGGLPTTTQTVVNGVVQIDDLIVEAGGRLLLRGPNPCTIIATGDVRIDGLVLLDGVDSAGVTTVSTTNVPEEGAPGQAGGGDGGGASERTDESTPKGGNGEGAFNEPDAGGEGGETGFAPPGFCEKDNRRGAGGGGGRLGPDVRYEWTTGSPTFVRCQTLIGFDAEPGFTGSFDGTGAVSGTEPSRGGDVGRSPFRDDRDDNDFFGAKLTPDGELVTGELTGVWAGAGGGGGGDASRTSTFPMTPFSPTGDEKGAGGGGGAGGLLVLASGAIELGANGAISANGGHGGAGENSIFFDRLGGGSGGGSGGHIILSSSERIVIAAEATGPSVGDFYLDDPLAPIHERRPLSALGGQGGAGRESQCGATPTGSTQWRQDSMPFEVFEGNPTVPPQAQPVWQSCNQVPDCAATVPPEGTTPGAGGDGGPGIIQLHVADPATQLLFPNASGTYGIDLDPTRSMAPPPAGWTRPTDPVDVFVPFFDEESVAVSRWIPLGLARLDPPNGAIDQVELLFDGIDPVDGSVLRSADRVEELAPIFDFTALSQGGPAPSVDVPSATFTVPGAGFDDLYRDNAALLRSFAIQIQSAVTSASPAEFIVQASSFDDVTGSFTVVVDPDGNRLADTLAATLQPEVALVPYFFRVATDGLVDRYPVGAEISIGFDATIIDPATGEPSANPADSFSGGSLGGFATDISELNMAVWDAFRFKVEFDIDLDPSSPRPSLDFIRIPYRF